MSSDERPELGTVLWRDLTVEDAEGIRDFYAEVVGWGFLPENMGAYEDYNMLSPDSHQRVAGICHARGPNADLPPQWLVYVTVADVEAAASRCRALGGEIVTGPKDLGGGRLCVIRDPAGAVMALWESAE